MTLERTCPDLADLKALLGGSLEEATESRLRQHLDACEDCQHRLAELVEGDDAVKEVARSLRDPRPDAATSLLKAIHALSQEGTTATVSSDLDVSLDFLTPADSPDALGKIGPYEITEVIGRGGMGIVLKGQDAKLNRVVAIKVLEPKMAGNATARRRFLREAQAAAAVTHQHVVTIHAVDEDRLPYLVMEFVDGLSLQKKIDLNGTLDLKEVLRIGSQISSGLAAAHAQGVIHRDIKPANILLENGVERVRITDFGLARAVDDVSVTKPGEVSGTPQYMSPEQAQGQQVDARSDLFNLGCVLYAMCTGRSPFRAETTVAAIRRVCDDTPRPIREVNPETPEWLVQIIDRLLQKDPRNRIQTAGEVADLLARHLAHVQDPGSTPQPGHVKREGVTGGGRARRRIIVVCGLILLLAGLGATEATDVTHVADFLSTVLRIHTPRGTLIVEVDDPGVQVSVEGLGERLTIKGAGIEKLELRPGQYEVRTLRDGAPIRTEMVTITRGDHRVIRVSLESAQETVETAEGITEIRRFMEYEGNVWSVAITPDSRYVLCTGGRSQDVPAVQNAALVFERETGRRLHTLLPAPIYQVAVAPDSQVAALAAYDGRIILCDIASGRQLGTLAGHTDHVWSMHFSSDGSRLLSGSGDQTVRLWDLTEHRELARLAFGAIATTVRLLPDGERAVLFCNSWAEGMPGPAVWNMTTGEPVRQFAEREAKVRAVDVTADGSKVLLAYSEWSPGDLKNALVLMDVATGEVVQTYRGALASPNACAITRDGRSIICGGRDQALRMWDARTGEQLHKIEIENYLPLNLALSADGQYAVFGGGEPYADNESSASHDHSVRLWRLPER